MEIFGKFFLEENMPFEIVRKEYNAEDMLFIIEALSLPFTRVVNKSYIFAKGKKDFSFFANVRDNADMQNSINSQNRGIFLLPAAKVSTGELKVPQDESFWISCLNKDVLLQEISSILGFINSGGIDLIIPAFTDEEFWSIVVIKLNKCANNVSFHLDCYIFDSSNSKKIYLGVNTALGLLISILVKNGFEYLSQKDSYNYLTEGNWKAHKATGVFCAAEVAALITDQGYTPEFYYSNIEELRRKQIEYAYKIPFNFFPNDISKCEKYYTRLNFLNRNTNLTRSVLLNALCASLEPLRNSNDLNFSKTLFVFVQHLIPQTVSLIKALLFFGAKPKNIFLLGKPYSTEIGVKEALREFAINIIENNENLYKNGVHFSHAFNQEVIELWKTCIKSTVFSAENPIEMLQILDDGGRSIIRACEILNHHESKEAVISKEEIDFFEKLEQLRIPIIATEQTTNGLDVYYTFLRRQLSKQKIIPVFMMASSKAKEVVEAGLIADQFIEKISSLIRTKVAAEFNLKIIKIGILGYGKIGSSITAVLLK